MPAEQHHPYVFVSYASVDRTRVFGIAGILETQGIPLWLDRRSITGGRRWTTEIVRGVEDCAVLLVMLSPASVASRNVQQEVQLAWESGRPTLPVIVEEVQIPPELRYALAGQQWVEVRDRLEAEWLPELVSALAAIGVTSATRRQETGGARRLPSDEATSMSSELVQDRRLHNLPAPRTSFVGRQSEMEKVAEALKQYRVVTLTGTAGIGKSRLALEVAWRLASGFSDGVWLAPLDSAGSLEDVAQRIAEAAEVPESALKAVSRQVVDQLSKRNTLLVLDNCDRVLDPTAELVATLTARGRNVRVLATSRQMLGTPGELVIELGPLAIPEADAGGPVEAIKDVESVQLFIDRAKTVQPGFALSRRNASAVVSICRSMDGVPLAIELAASRVRTLPEQELAARLGDALEILRGTDRTAAPRHRTLIGAIDWSYGSLSSEEQVIWRRLSVFAGDFTLDAVERVCGFVPIAAAAVLELVTALADKSMLITVRSGDEVRYRLLRTLKLHAAAKLSDSQEATLLAERHLDWCRSIVHSGDRNMIDRHWAETIQAVKRLLDAGDRGREALDIVGTPAMWALFTNTHRADGVAVLRALLEQVPQEPTRQFGWALAAFNRLAGSLDFAGVQNEQRRSLTLDIARRTGEHQLVVQCLNDLGLLYGWGRGEFARGRALLEEAVAIGHAHGLSTAVPESNIPLLHFAEGDVDKARDLLQSHSQWQTDPRFGFAQVLLGFVALLSGDLARAEEIARSAYSRLNRNRNLRLAPTALMLQAMTLLELGRYAEAETTAAKGLSALFSDEGLGLGGGLVEVLAWTAFYRGDPTRAATLMPLSQALYRIWPRNERFTMDRLGNEARQALSPEQYDDALARGKAMTLEQAIAYALGEADSGTATQEDTRHGPS